MESFTPDAAIKLVRNNLDELDTNGSAMYDTDNDNNSLDDTIKRHLPEAINAIHLVAPVGLLDAETAAVEVLECNKAAEGVWVLEFAIDEPEFLRFVALESSESPGHFVTEVYSIGSVGSRKQLNPFIRGRYDRPRLVQVPSNGSPQYRFYSFKTKGGRVTPYIVKRQNYAADATGYNYSSKLKQNIVDCLTAKVMETFGDQRAQSFYQRANIFPTI